MMSVEIYGHFCAYKIYVVSYPRAVRLMPRRAVEVFSSGKDEATFCLTV